jgi:hypothetical protein
MLSLEDQDKVVSNEKGGYFFWDSFLKGRTTMSTFTPAENWTREQIEEMQQVFQQDFSDLEIKSRLAESQGKVFFGKEHIQWFTDPAINSSTTSPINITIPSSYNTATGFSANNPTIFPDGYLATWRLTFLIRHPALAFPSFYRAMRHLESEDFAESHEIQPMMELNTTLRWTRQLYNWCCEHKIGYDSGLPLPLILDAEDVIHSPKVVIKYADLIGLDPARVRFEWEAGIAKSAHINWSGTGERGPETIMKATIDNSSSILKDKTPALVDISLERRGWDLEFGEIFGRQMEKWVRDAMPDYDYLRARRLQT